MSEAFVRQDNPVIVPTQDNKVIAEHFGRASTGTGAVSIARMTAPSGWSEPAVYWSVCIPAFSPDTVNQEE